ncbi:MAG: hypothetical protein ACREWG_07135, partial [Gammaproteobacteria bacterium]
LQIYDRAPEIAEKTQEGHYAPLDCLWLIHVLDLLLVYCGFGIVHVLVLESHVPPAFSQLAFVFGSAALAPMLTSKRPVIATARNCFKELLFILILL